MIDNKILKVSSDVKWVGVLDYGLVTFDVVLTTDYGSTYNSYFINAEKKVIIDTSKKAFWEDYERKIRSVTDPADIEYIIMSHTEPDHSGNLEKLLEINLTALKFKFFGEGFFIKFSPGNEDVEAAFDYGIAFGKQLLST